MTDPIRTLAERLRLSLSNNFGLDGAGYVSIDGQAEHAARSITHRAIRDIARQRLSRAGYAIDEIDPDLDLIGDTDAE